MEDANTIYGDHCALPKVRESNGPKNGKKGSESEPEILGMLKISDMPRNFFIPQLV
jgi:hypothetical protein